MAAFEVQLAVLVDDELGISARKATRAERQVAEAAIVWAIDTVHQALVLKVGYVYLVTEFSNPAYVGTLNP